MIWETLSFLSTELNNTLRIKMRFEEDLVILSNIVNSDGTPAIPDGVRVIVSLVKIEPDTVPTPSSVSKSSLDPTPLFLNIYVMFSVSSKTGNYAESLKLLGAVISFFQTRSVFTAQQNPALARHNIHKLAVEMTQLEFMEQSNLWSALGAKYLPSVVYRIRKLTFDNDNFMGVLPQIRGVNTDNTIRE